MDLQERELASVQDAWAMFQDPIQGSTLTCFGLCLVDVIAIRDLAFSLHKMDLRWSHLLAFKHEFREL